MNKVTAILTLCFVLIAAMAQTVGIEVSYVAHYPNMRDGKTDLTNQYILLTNTTESKYFSPITEYIDSMNSTPEGKAKLNEMTKNAFLSGKTDDIPRPKGTIYVVKSFADGKLKHYDVAGIDKYVYEEPIDQWNWETGDSAIVILGYECVMANTSYHGRKWTVWFAPEIPVRNGPWKLGGLPGLILEAEAEGGQYRFVATGIRQTTRPVGPVFLAGDYERTSRLSYLKAQRSFMDNPLGKLNAQFGSKGVTVSASNGEDLKNIYVSASVADFLETDYH